MQGNVIDMNGFMRDREQDSDREAGAEQRSHLRTGMLMTAMLRIADDDAREVRIRNLSEQGLMAEPGHAVAAGTPVSVELPGIGAVAGSVAWSAEGRIGVALDAPIDVARVNAARQGQ